MLVEIWTVKAILMRSQIKMRNKVLKIGAKTIFTIQLQRTNSHPRTTWNTDPKSNELECLVEGIPKQRNI